MFTLFVIQAATATYMGWGAMAWQLKFWANINCYCNFVPLKKYYSSPMMNIHCGLIKFDHLGEKLRLKMWFGVNRSGGGGRNYTEALKGQLTPLLMVSVLVPFQSFPLNCNIFWWKCFFPKVKMALPSLIDKISSLESNWARSPVAHCLTSQQFDCCITIFNWVYPFTTRQT